MKICLVSGVYPPRIGGPATQSRQLAIELKKKGMLPIVITFGKRNEVRKVDNITVYYLNSYELPFIGPLAQYVNALWQLIKILISEKPDIIHHQTGCDYFCVIVSLVAKLLNIPSIVKYAGDLVWERTNAAGLVSQNYEAIFTQSFKARILTKLERFAFNNFSLVWATSNFQQNSLIKILKIAKEKVLLMPNYVILENGQLHGRKSGDKLVILSVCRFTPWKRVDNTILAFARIKAENAILKIVGGENPLLEAQFKNLVAKLQIGNKVEFVGAVPPTEVKLFFCQADIFVSSTVYEPFGIVFVEAMEAGLPIVTTKVGGIPDVVPVGLAGFLVEPDDVEQMAKKLQRLIDEPALRERFGNFGRQHVSKFDLHRNICRFIDIYSQLKK